MYCAFNETDLVNRINDPDVSVRLSGVQDAMRLQANTPAIIAAIKGRINGPKSEFFYVSGSAGQAVINSSIATLGRLGDADLVSTSEEDYLASLIDNPPIINQYRNADPTSFQYDGSVVGNTHAIDSELMIFQTSNYNFKSMGATVGDKIVIRNIRVADSPADGVWIDRTYVNGSLILTPVRFNTTSPEDVATRNSIITTMKAYSWGISSVSDDGYSVTVTRDPIAQPFKVTGLTGGTYTDVTGHFFQVSGAPSNYVVYFSAIRLDALDYALYDSLGNLKYESYVPQAPVIDVDNSLFHKALTKAIVADALTDMASRKYVKPSTVSSVLDNLHSDALASSDPELEVSTYATSTLLLAKKASQRYDPATASALKADIVTKFYSPGSPSLGCGANVQAGEDPTNTCITYFSPIVTVNCVELQPVYVNKPVTFRPTVFDSSDNLALDAGLPTTGAHTMTYAWDFGDGVGRSTLPSPTYTYAAPGTFHVVLLVTDSTSGLSQDAACDIEVLTEYVTVDVPSYVVPDVPFCITVSYQYSEDLTIEPFGISVNGNGCYEVTLPNPGTVHGTVGPTQFNVTAVSPLSLNLTSDAVNCPHVSKSFMAIVSGGLEPYFYQWTIDGEPFNGVGGSLTKVFEVGEHTVGVTVTDSMGTIITGNVDFVIYPRLDAYINYAISNVSGVNRVPGYTVDLAPCVTSAGAPDQYSYVWDFGDNSTATGADQVHTYSSPAEYQIKLRIMDPNGCSDPIDIGSRIQVWGSPTILLQNITEDKQLCPGKIIGEFTILHGLAPYSLTVDTGDGQRVYPTLKDGVFSFEHFYSTAGHYVVHITVVDAQAISASLDTSVNVG
jgi:PKD repeat protein